MWTMQTPNGKWCQIYDICDHTHLIVRWISKWIHKPSINMCWNRHKCATMLGLCVVFEFTIFNLVGGAVFIAITRVNRKKRLQQLPKRSEYQEEKWKKKKNGFNTVYARATNIKRFIRYVCFFFFILLVLCKLMHICIRMTTTGYHISQRLLQINYVCTAQKSL